MLLRVLRITTCLASLAALSGCAGTQAPTSAATAPAAASSGSAFLWRARMPGKPGEVYLLGSVHLRSLDDASLDKAVADAVKGADTVALELIPDEVDQAQVQAYIREHGLLPEGDSLAQHLSPERYRALQDALKRLGRPVAVFDRMQPWFAAMTLTVQHMKAQGFDPEAGVDVMTMWLARREPSRKRTLRALETAVEQLEALRAAMDSSGDAVIAEALRSVESNETRTLMELYRRGDEAGLATFVSEQRAKHPESEPAMKVLLDQRNTVMVERILPFFESPGRSVVVVGAAHLPGATGVLRGLQDRGAQLAPVPARGPASAELMALARPRAQPSKPFTSPRVGFRAVLPGKPQPQPTPTPGSHAVLVPIKEHGVLTVTSLPRASARPDLAPAELASAMAGQMFETLQMRPGPPRDAKLAGKDALRIDAQGAAGWGSTVLLVTDTRLFSLTAIAMSSDAQEQDQVRAHFETLLSTFEELPAREAPAAQAPTAP